LKLIRQNSLGFLTDNSSLASWAGFKAISLLIALGTALISLSCNAQSVTPEPLRLIVPFPKGGSTYLTAELLAHEFEKSMNRPVSLSVIVGNNSMKAQEALTSAAKDGNTLFVGTVITNALVPVLFEHSANVVNPKAIEPISRLADFPSFVVTSAKSNSVDVRTLIEHLKSTSGVMRNGSDFTGGASFLSAHLLGRRFGLKVEQVSINGAQGLLDGVIGGALDIVFLNSSTAGPAIKAKSVRALALTGSSRLENFPEVSTLEEQGLQGIGINMWQGLFAAKGVAPSTLQNIFAYTQKALNSDDFKSLIAQNNAFVTPSTSTEQFSKELELEKAHWSAVMKDAGLVQ